MSSNRSVSFRQLTMLLWAIALGLAVSACSSGPLARMLHGDEGSPEAALVYYHGLSHLTPAELVRERAVLGAIPQLPFAQIRLAMLLGHPRAVQDLGKGLGLLEGILKSSDAAALPYHTLARLMADNYLERLKFESQLERQGGLLKESQRKTAELQEKLDSLANIEKSLIQRPRGVRPNGAKQ